MAQKKLLRAVVLLLLLSGAHAHELEDLIRSQDSIIKKHMPDVKIFINEVNANTSKHQFRAEEIIKNSNLSCQKYENTDWLKKLIPPRSNAMLPMPHELYIFVSLSMPQSRLINLLQEAKSYGGLVVLRGLKNNSYKDTANFLQPIIKAAEAGVIIDPHLFEKYEVSKVPTFVLNDQISKKYDKATGNVSLKYVLEEIGKVGELQSQAQVILGQRS